MKKEILATFIWVFDVGGTDYTRWNGMTYIAEIIILDTCVLFMGKWGSSGTEVAIKQNLFQYIFISNARSIFF